MIYKIADLLRDEIKDLNFVEIAVGLAKPTVVKVPTPGDEVALTPIIVPMARNTLDDQCVPGDLLPMVPDTTKMSIHFWEDQGIELLDEDTYYYHSQASLRLVSWWNLPLINTEYTDASLLVANLIANIPEELTTVDYLSQIQVIFNGEETGTNVIAAYNFDEPENQFTTYPYFYTALNYSVEFAFGKNCVDAVTLSPSECP